MHYGFIGLGNLGGQLAVRLLDAGFQVTVFDLDSTATETLVSAGANPANCCVSLARWVHPWCTLGPVWRHKGIQPGRSKGSA